MKAAGPARRGSSGAQTHCSVSCRAVQVSWFKGCSLRQEIVSCSEVYCNKVYSPGGMCCWAHESLYGLAVLTSAPWFIHAIPQQEWQKCKRHMVFPASPFPTRWAWNWEAAINPHRQVCSGLPVPRVLPTLPRVCWGILLLLRCFLCSFVAFSCEKMKTLSAVVVLLAEIRHLEVCKFLVILFFLLADNKQQNKKRDPTVFSSECPCFTDVTRCVL